MSNKKSKQAVSMNHLIDGLGSSRVYAYQKHSKAVKEYLYTPFSEKDAKVKQIEDFIFGRAEESGLEEINKELERDLKDIDKRREALVAKIKS